MRYLNTFGFSFAAAALILSGCAEMQDQVLISPRDPEAGATGRSEYFRDPAVHYSRESMGISQGVAAPRGFVVTTHESFPAESFHRKLAEADWSRYELVPFVATSESCRNSLVLPIPVKGSGGTTLQPISFVFGPDGFYEELRKVMEKEKVRALVDARLDTDTLWVLFYFRRTCHVFHGWGLRERSSRSAQVNGAETSSR